MTAGLQPYPEYKNSGVPWVGQVPAHWPEKRAKYYFKEIDERSQTGDEEMLSVSHITGVTPRSQKNVTMFKAESNVGQKKCQPGDLVINTMWAWMAALGVSSHAGIVSPSYGVYRPRDNEDYDHYYLDHLLRVEGYRSEYICRSTGVRSSRLRLYPDKFLSMRLVCPPIEEQKAVSRFLKTQDLLFRKFIRNKRQLIELLKEQKQNIINHAITRGINTDVKFKHSGVEWLGDIPEHWEVRRLKYLTQFLNGIAFKPGDWKEQGIPIIRIQNLNGSSEFNFTDRNDLPSRLLIEPGELLFAWSGNKGTSFGPFMWDRKFPAYLNQHIFKLVRYRLHSRYFYYQLRTVTKHVEEQAQGIIGLVHITKPELGAISVPLPCLEEQKAIAGYLDGKLASLDAAISRAEQEIKLIREYRARLISDVVTGKVDVRGIEVPEVADEEPLGIEEEIEGPDEMAEDAMEAES